MEFTEPTMRPPQEASSLLLQVTQGCTWNKCNFCYVSRGYPFMAIKPEKLAERAMAAKPFIRPDTRVYFMGSNPFALPARKLKEYIAALRVAFPKFERLSMQSRVDDIARKTDAELVELRDLGLKHLYLGVENGDEDTLLLMNKGHTAKDTVEQLQRLDAAGITYTTFYVLGLGGKGRGRICGEATAAMLNQVNPERITTTGMTIFEGTPLAEMVAGGRFVEPSEREKIEELRAFLGALRVNAFYDGIHYLNPVNYRFQNSDTEAKQRALADMDEILRDHTDEELELMVNREMMKSL